MKLRPLRAIIHTVSSAQDVNGNRYHFARITNPAKGRNAFITLHTEGESNGRGIALALAGGDCEAVYTTCETVGKRDWKRMSSHLVHREGADHTMHALASIFDLPKSRVETVGDWAKILPA